MFDSYKTEVVLACKKKREAGVLSLNLVNSTPAKLRAECIIVLSERYLKKDEHTLRIFFGAKENLAAYMQAIRKFDADKFKPLDNFLKGITNDTEDKNIELLAWLIDFEPRPYQFGIKNIINAASDDNKIIENKDVKPVGAITNIAAAPVITNVNVKQDSNTNIANIQKMISGKPMAAKHIVMLSLVIAAASISVFWLFHYKPKSNFVPHSIITGQQKCMYWTGDYYQPVSCNQHHGDTLIVALDTNLLYNFKRVTKPDTVTRYSVHKLWYLKINQEIQLFTDSARNPFDPNKHVMPLTIHMLNKYILHVKDTVPAHHISN